eukprot:SAG11_NODE_3834_length_2196_cov_1.893181_2_plen_153_part_00
MSCVYVDHAAHCRSKKDFDADATVALYDRFLAQVYKDPATGKVIARFTVRFYAQGPLQLREYIVLATYIGLELCVLSCTSHVTVHVCIGSPHGRAGGAVVTCRVQNTRCCSVAPMNSAADRRTTDSMRCHQEQKYSSQLTTVMLHEDKPVYR